MENYPVDIDIDPEQIVRWLMVERQRGASDLDIGAWRLNQGVRSSPGWKTDLVMRSGKI